MEPGLEDMRQRGMTIEPSDVARHTPIGHEHINVYGKYSFALAEPVRQGAFHSLRELDKAGDIEDDEEVELPTEGAEISFRFSGASGKFCSPSLIH